MSSENIGERLIGIRKSANLNQTEFAKRLGTSSGYISEIETNKSIPGGKFLISLNREFGVDINWFLSGEVSDRQYPTGVLVTELYVKQELISPRERALIENYRASSDEGKNAMEVASAALAQPIKKPKMKM